MLTFADVTATRALQGAGEAPAVQEKDDLLSLFQFLLHVHPEAVGEDGGTTLTLLRLSPHIHDSDERQGLTVCALGQAYQVILAGQSILKGLQGWSGRSEYHGTAFQMRTHHCEVTALVFGRIFLLVCILVFFVYDYETWFG